MRRWAEKAMVAGENPVTVVSFFRTETPKTGNGWARLAESYSATGKPTGTPDRVIVAGAGSNKVSGPRP